MNNDSDKDKLNDKKLIETELRDDKLIQERGYKSDPGLLWIWAFMLVAIVAILWGAGSWYAGYLGQKQADRPFLQVTNRDMSLFLWQNPEFMRVNAKTKSGYLPGFQYTDRVSVEPALADQFAIAPPEVLFRYHTWSRLIGEEYIARPIPVGEFSDFLDYCQEWQPKYWKDAPEAYKNTVAALDRNATLNLAQLPESTLPNVVRIAFQGWKNYMVEGAAINQLKPTYKQVSAFLRQHPHFARNFWQNIFDDESHRYLGSLAKQPDSDQVVPDSELAPFLKVVLFNFLQAARE